MIANLCWSRNSLWAHHRKSRHLDLKHTFTLMNAWFSTCKSWSSNQQKVMFYKKSLCSACFLKWAKKEAPGNGPEGSLSVHGKVHNTNNCIFSTRLRGAFASPVLLSIHAVLAGSDAHLAKAFSSVIGGYSSLKILQKHTKKTFKLHINQEM